MKSIDAATTADNLIRFIGQTCNEQKFANSVLGVSGGVDSATSLILSVSALGASHVYPLLLPYGSANLQGTLDALSFCTQLHIPVSNITRIDVQPAVDVITKGVTDNVRKGNIIARTRMIYLFDAAKKRQALVVGTENKSEHLLGYYTRFGDEASDIEPLRNLYKTQVYELARHLKIPDQILSKEPSAELWFGQTDAAELGFTYEQADPILEALSDGRKTKEQIIHDGHPESIVSAVFARVESQAFKTRVPILAPAPYSR